LLKMQVVQEKSKQSGANDKSSFAIRFIVVQRCDASEFKVARMNTKAWGRGKIIMGTRNEGS